MIRITNEGSEEKGVSYDGSYGIVVHNSRHETLVCLTDRTDKNIAIFQEDEILTIEPFDEKANVLEWCKNHGYTYVRLLGSDDEFTLTIAIGG